MRPRKTIALCLLALAFAAARPARAAHYVITDLGALGGATNSYAYGISTNGEVTGISGTDAFLYSGGTMTDLGLDGFSDFSKGCSVNSSGEVVGWGIAPEYGFLYGSGTWTTLRFDGIGFSSYAFAINDAGQVVGQSKLGSSDDSASDAFLYSNGTYTDLGCLGAGSYSYGKGISPDGTYITGTSNTNPLTPGSEAFLYTGGTMYDLNVVAAVPATSRMGVNNSGQVVGSTNSGIGFIDQKLGGIYTPTTLGTLGGSTSTADSINSAGVVVGGAATGTATHAYVWTPAEPNSASGTMADLNGLMNGSLGWTLTEATGINDNGWIAGYGINPSGNTDPFLLKPAIAGDANLDGKVDINDLTIVLANYGQNAGMSWGTGDFNNDGKVDINDLTIVLAHYGQSLGSSAPGLSAVPEPSSLILLSIGAIGLTAVAWQRVGQAASGLPALEKRRLSGCRDSRVPLE